MSTPRRRRLFATPASEPRARRFTDVVLLAVATLGLLLASAAEFPAPGFVVAVGVFLRSAPSFLETVWQISADLLSLFALVLVVAVVVRRRLDVVRDIAIALVTASVVWMLVGRWAHGEWPAMWSAMRSAQPPSWYPSPRVALPTAVIVTAAPHLTRPVRRLGRWLVLLGCLGVTALGATSLLGAVAGVLVGTAAAAAVHLAFGSSAGRPSVDDVRVALEQVGVRTRSLSPASRQPAGLFELEGEDEHGQGLVIKVYGRDAHDSALASTLWRTLWYREPGAPLRIGRLQQVEHEALVTLLAAQFGVITEQVVTAGSTAQDDAVLVLRAHGATLASLDQPQLDVADVWSMLAALHRGGIAHGRVDHTTLIVDTQPGGTLVGLVDFGAAGVGASESRMHTDRAQALVATALLTEPGHAIEAAHSALGTDGLGEMLPYLQSAALTPSQRRRLKDSDLDLDDLRARAAETAAVEVPELQQFRRVTLGSVLRLVLPVLAVTALWVAISGFDLENVFEEIIDATWWLLLLGFVVAQLTRVSQASSTLGASPVTLPFGPVYGLQLAMSYIAIAVPSYAARVAVSVRFFQRQAVPAGAALAAGALDTMTTFFIEVIGIVALVLFTPASLDLDLSGATSAAKRLALLAGVIIVVAFAVVLVMRRLRQLLVDWAKRLGTEAMAVLRGLHSPRRLALLLGGNLATEVLFTVALGIFARAMGTTVPFADLLLIHLTVSLLAGLVPVPGGVGVAEAILTYGLVRSGMNEEAAFAAVICYRSSTFYLPPIWGFFALHWLERNKHL